MTLTPVLITMNTIAIGQVITFTIGRLLPARTAQDQSEIAGVDLRRERPEHLARQNWTVSAGLEQGVDGFAPDVSGGDTCQPPSFVSLANPQPMASPLINLESSGTSHEQHSECTKRRLQSGS